MEAMQKHRNVRQLLPIYISSIKSVVLPNPTTKQGKCAHTHGRKHMKHIKSFTEPTKPGVVKKNKGAIHSQLLNFLYHVSVYLPVLHINYTQTANTALQATTLRI